MKTKKKVLIVLIIIACVCGVLLDLYYQSLLKIETGDDYEGIKDLTFFVNEPESCVWVKGLGQTFLDIQSFIKCETTVVLMQYEDRKDIQFFKEYELSRKWFEEEYEGEKQEYGRLLDKISPNLLDKEWEHVYMEGYFRGFDTDYLYSIYIYQNEVLIIATDASW